MSDWKLVPVEPTAEMLNTWAQKWPEPAYVGPHPRREILGWTTVKSIYQAMLKAAPSAPTQGADGESLRPVATETLAKLCADHFGCPLNSTVAAFARALLATRDAAPSDASSIGFITEDDIERLSSGMGAIISPTNGVATVPVYVACDVAPREKTK